MDSALAVVPGGESLSARLDSHNHLVEDLVVEVSWDTVPDVRDFVAAAYRYPLECFRRLLPVPVSAGNLKSSCSMV